MTSNVKQQYAGIGLRRRQRTASRAPIETLFRPSDIAVGPDGALYVSDWIDARVGGHQDLDDTLSGAIYRIAPKGFVSNVPALRRRDDRRPDHGAAIAGGQRPGDRVRRAEGARRGGRERRRGAAQGSQPVHARPGDLPSLSARSRGPAARGDARVADRSGAAHRRLPRDAARRSRRHAGRGASRARHGPRRPARGGAVDARPAGRRRRWTSWSTIARGFDGKDRSYLEALGTGATGKEPALYDRLRRELGVKDDPLAWSGDVRVDGVAAARAGGGAGSRGPRAVVEAVARRAPPRDRYARLRQRSGRVEGDAEPGGAEQPAA